MEKSFFLLCAFLLYCTSPICDENWPKIYDCTLQKWCSFEQLQDALCETDIVFVGEVHDHIRGHKVEEMLLQAFSYNHAHVAMALEMFERDVQHILDGYLAGEVSKEFFLRHARPWKNYDRDYAPLIEFARDYRLPVLAMNVPRRYAACVAKGDEEFLSTLPDLEKSFAVDRILALPGTYRDKFYKTMEGHVPPAMIEFYYRAQCLKDDTMAKSIAEFLKENPYTSVISYTGAFHSDERLGLVEKVVKQMPLLKISVLSIIPVATLEIPNPEQHSHLADFILFAPANDSTEISNLD